MSSNPLTPSFRNVHRIPSGVAHDSVRKAIRDNDQSITDINQAIQSLKGQITSNTKAITNNITENVTTETVTGSEIGGVNNQLGNPFYTTQQSDYGAKILAGDSTSVGITLNPTVTIPWFTVIGNDSTNGVSLSTTSPANLYGVRNISPGCFVLIYYDGGTFWSEGVEFATDSVAGVVKPDSVTTEVNASGEMYTKVSVGGGPPSGVPATPGNPFYFDSTASPWHGYVYFGGWNRFS